MWFKLNTTFTQSLGTLDSLSNSWSITRNLTNFSTSSTVTSVTKNGSYSATFTLNSGCTYSSHSVTMGGATVTSGVSYSNGTLTVNISKVTGAVVITAVATGASSGGGTTPTPPSGGDTDPEIGTTTTFGSTNVEVTIIGNFSDFDFVNKCVVSTGGGSSCSLNTAGASGRVSSATQILKVSGGETVTFNSSISGLQYALIEFTNKPCTLSTLNKNGQYGQAWSTAASQTLQPNTKYLTINFNNGSADMTTTQLESLKTAIVLS